MREESYKTNSEINEICLMHGLTLLPSYIISSSILVLLERGRETIRYLCEFWEKIMVLSLGFDFIFFK